MKQIRQFACGATQTSRQRRRVVRRLLALVEQHFEDPLRRDRRGRRSQDLRAVEKAVGHMTNATSWQHRQNLDANARREARALVQTACHGQTPLRELMKRASALRGLVNKCGRLRNARKPIEGCEPLSVRLFGGYSVERLHTVAKLASAGRALGNCAKDNGHGLHDGLRQRHSDFYLVWCGRAPVAMLEVELETDEITEFLGPSNADVELSCFVLRDLLRQLRLNGDHVDACLQRGLAAIFTSGAASFRKPSYQRGRVRIWQARRYLVVKEGSRPGRGWSSFRWDGTGWAASRASSRERLDDLMTRYPDIAVVANKAMSVLRLRRRPRRARRR